MNMYPKVSVIIPMYNARKTIKNCIKSVLSSDYPNFEVIVVDDTSTDNSASLISTLPCNLIVLAKNSGPGIARNEGVKAAKGEILAFTDADCEVSPSWLRRIAEDLTNNDIKATSGGYSKSINNGTIATFQFYDTHFRQRNISEYISSCITSNFACQRKVFTQIGGFPPQRVNEDMEFGIKMSERHKILWNRNNGVAHYFNNRLYHYFPEQVSWSESVVRAYFSNPKAILENSTWKNHEIFGHLLITFILYLALIGFFWSFNLVTLGLFSGIIVLYCIMNFEFIRWACKKEGNLFAFKMFPLLLIRNTAWLLGIARGIVRHLGRMLWEAVKDRR